MHILSRVKGFFKVLVNTTQSDKTMKKGFTNFLIVFKIMSQINFFKSATANNVGTGHSIYKTEIFEGLTEKKEKSLRKKLRQSLEDAVKDFKDNVINWESWQAYAESVYNNFTEIYNGKRIADSDLKSFVNAWETWRKKQTSAPAKKGK